MNAEDLMQSAPLSTAVLQEACVIQADCYPPLPKRRAHTFPPATISV